MTDTGAGAYRAWTDAFGDIYDALPERAEVRCPRCGRTELEVAFIGDPETRIGYAFLWCRHCLHGIHRSRLEVPPGVVMFDIDEPSGRRAGAIPEFTLVEPVADEDDDDDEGWITADDVDAGTDNR